MYVVIKRHEQYGNRVVYGPFNTVKEACEFSEKIGNETAYLDKVHYDVLLVIPQAD